MNGFLRNYPSLSAPLTSTAQVAEGRKFPAAPADAFSLESTHTSTLLHTHDVAMRPTTTRTSDTNRFTVIRSGCLDVPRAPH